MYLATHSQASLNQQHTSRVSLYIECSRVHTVSTGPPGSVSVLAINNEGRGTPAVLEVTTLRGLYNHKVVN